MDTTTIIILDSYLDSKDLQDVIWGLGRVAELDEKEAQQYKVKVLTIIRTTRDRTVWRAATNALFQIDGPLWTKIEREHAWGSLSNRRSIQIIPELHMAVSGEGSRSAF
jgi:hypothetical protein